MKNFTKEFHVFVVIYLMNVFVNFVFFQEYTNGDRYIAQQQCRQSDEISTHSHDTARRERYQCPAAHRPPFNRRPVTRVR